MTPASRATASPPSSARLKAQLPILEVQLDAAIREEARLARLIAEDAASQQLYEQAQDNTRQLRAQVEAQKLLDRPRSRPAGRSELPDGALCHPRAHRRHHRAPLRQPGLGRVHLQRHGDVPAPA
jgi:hypothetical protein